MGVEFTNDGLAAVINGFIANILSAIIIFLFIWLFRKRPVIEVNHTLLWGANATYAIREGDQPIQAARDYPCEIKFKFHNESNYHAYNFEVYKIEYDHYRLIDLKPLAFNHILANETKETKISFTLTRHPLSIQDLSQADRYILPFIKKKMVLKAKYKNEDGRPFYRTIIINL